MDLIPYYRPVKAPDTHLIISGYPANFTCNQEVRTGPETYRHSHKQKHGRTWMIILKVLLKMFKKTHKKGIFRMTTQRFHSFRCYLPDKIPFSSYFLPFCVIFVSSYSFPPFYFQQYISLKVSTYIKKKVSTRRTANFSDSEIPGSLYWK